MGNLRYSLSDVVEEDATLQQERSILLLVRGATGDAQGGGGIRFLENRITLADLLAIGAQGIELLATENDFLEEEHVVFPVHLRFRDGENVVEKKRAKVGDMVTLPIFDAAFQILHGREVFRPALRLVDLIGDPFRGSNAVLELF